MGFSFHSVDSVYPKVLNFDEVIFPFVAYNCRYRKIHWQIKISFFPMFSLNSIIVLVLTFRFLSHFKLSFQYWVRKVSNFNLLQWVFCCLNTVF